MAQLVEVLKTTRQRTLHFAKTISPWWKKKFAKIRFCFSSKSEMIIILKVAFPFADSSFFERRFWPWRSKPLARMRTRSNFHSISIWGKTQTSSSFEGVDFASKQRIDISCFCWQTFPLVCTHHLPMKVPVVISLCLVLFKTAKQFRNAMLESVAVPRPLQLLSLRLKHATSCTDATPGKKRKNSTNNWTATKKVEFLVQVQLQTHYLTTTHKGFAKKREFLWGLCPLKCQKRDSVPLCFVGTSPCLFLFVDGNWNLFVFFGPFLAVPARNMGQRKKKFQLPSTKRKKRQSTDKKSGTESRLTFHRAKSLWQTHPEELLVQKIWFCEAKNLF